MIHDPAIGHDNVTHLRFPRHDHDVLCPIKHEEHITRENCTFCTLIDAARADERKQAAQRVAAVPLLGNMRGRYAVSQTRAIAAARGEEP